MKKLRIYLKNLLQKYYYLNKFYRAIFSKIISTTFMCFKLDDKKIVFSSFSGRSFNDSPKLIYDLIKSDPFFSEYKLIWIFEEPQHYRRMVSHVVKIDTIIYFYHIMTAKVWVTNVNIDRGLEIKRKGTVYINTWHGTPLKKIGNDVDGRSDFNWRDVDIACITGDYEKEIFKKKFLIRY